MAPETVLWEATMTALKRVHAPPIRRCWETRYVQHVKRCRFLRSRVELDVYLEVCCRLLHYDLHMWALNTFREFCFVCAQVGQFGPKSGRDLSLLCDELQVGATVP